MKHMNGAHGTTAPSPPTTAQPLPNVPVPTTMRVNVTPRWYVFQAGSPNTWKDANAIAEALSEYEGPLKTIITGLHVTVQGVFLDLFVPTDLPNEVRNFQLGAMEVKETFDVLDQANPRRLRITSARAAEASQQAFHAMAAQRAALAAAAPAEDVEPNSHVTSLLAESNLD